MARCESEENALVTCSLKSGDVESAKIPRAQCLILIDLFNAQDKELDFIGKLKNLALALLSLTFNYA